MSVFCFLMKTVDSPVSIFFTPEGNDCHRSRRKDRLCSIVLEEHASQNISACEEEEAEFRSKEVDYTAEGCVQLEAEEGMWSSPKMLVWFFACGCYFAVACEREVNLLLATGTLMLIASTLAERLGGGGQLPAQLHNKPEEALHLASALLFGGRLQIMDPVAAKSHVQLITSELVDIKPSSNFKVASDFLGFGR